MNRLEPFDVEAIFREIDELLPPFRQPGDIDSKQLAETRRINRARALDMMRRLVKEHPDRFTILTVFDPDQHRALVVLRKIDPDKDG